MSKDFASHFERLVAASSKEKSLYDVPEWLTKNTFLYGRPYSFSGRRYQLDILRDSSVHLGVKKPSQVGLSEMIARMMLARSSIIQPYNVIYAMPTAGAARDFCKARVTPIIDQSPALSDMVDKKNDSTTMKGIGVSLLHFKGAFSDAQAISTPADAVIADEYDFCDVTVVNQYNSRLTASPHKHFIKFSTPTLPGVGMDKEMSESRRFYRKCKCKHCNHWFWPDFLKHCRIVGHEVDWMTLTKPQLENLPWQRTSIFCPSCGKIPDLSHEYREWVCENPDSNYLAAGYNVSPFDVPSIIKPSYLAEKSVAYNRKIDWMNVNLGMAAEDKESTLLPSELLAIDIQAQQGIRGHRVLGVDLGLTCHFVVAVVLADDTRIVIHKEKVPVGNLEKRYHEVCKEFSVRVAVMDFLPYSETVLRLQSRDPRLFAALYTQSKGTDVFTPYVREADEVAGVLESRRVSINRDLLLDAIMQLIRSKIILNMLDGINDADWRKHLVSMKRIKCYTADEQLTYKWEKTDGEDHFHHALGYAEIAARMCGMAIAVSGSALPLVTKIKVGGANQPRR